MRFVHTADWHLGRLFHGMHLTDDQAFVLDQLVELVADVRPDAVLVSGDVYDRAVPPPDAVELLDDCLARIAGDLGVPMVLIAGNHDSPRRLGFAARLLAGRGVHVFSRPSAAPAPVVLEDEHGPVHVWAVPYAEPATAREVLGRDDLTDHDAALGALIEAVHERRDRNVRSVLVAHAFVVGGQACDSERPLSAGGSDNVNATRFDPFDYVALGHLHRAQAAGGRDHVRYAGSPLKYSFSEAGQTKSVNVIEMDARGDCRIEAVPLGPRRDVRRIEGHLTDLLAAPPAEGRDDYLHVTLLDRGAVLDALGRLRAVYPHVMELSRPHFAAGADGPAEGRDPRRRGVLDLFEDFFEQVTGESLTDEERAAVERVTDEDDRDEREAVA